MTLPRFSICITGEIPLVNDRQLCEREDRRTHRLKDQTSKNFFQLPLPHPGIQHGYHASTTAHVPPKPLVYTVNKEDMFERQCIGLD